MKNLDNKNILIIGEFPVIHRGYTDVFDKILEKNSSKAHFYLGFLSKQMIKELTKLEPDIRKVSDKHIKRVIKVFIPIEKFFLVTKSNFFKLLKDFDKIIVLKGEKSEDFGKKYLSKDKYKKLVEFYDVRLIWSDEKVAELKKENSDISRKESEKYRKIMNQVFRQTEKSKCFWRQTGSALVKNKRIVLTAFNEMLPTSDECHKIGCIRDDIEAGKISEICSAVHAEASIIAQAANKGISLKNTVLYATHFPCPACAKLIALSGIKKVIYSRGHAVFDGARVMKSRGVKLIKV